MITSRRIRRAIAARLSRTVLRIVNRLIGEKRLRCNACGQPTAGFWTFEGRPFGCPACKSSSRERFVLQALESGHLRIPNDSRILHVAPSEQSINRVFNDKAVECVCADIDPETYPGLQVLALDLTTLASRADLGQFDVIYASHVLEHVLDLGAALAGIRSRLSERGQAWFLFPIGTGPTIEDPELKDRRERERRFGQWDHVRLFGDDAQAVIAQFGFDLSVLSAGSLAAEKIDSLGLDPLDRVFVCVPDSTGRT